MESPVASPPAALAHLRTIASLFAFILASGVLSSCGTQLAINRNVSSSEPTLSSSPPSHYGEATRSKAMASSVPEIYDEGPAIKAQMLELIGSAEDYILVSSFLLTADEHTWDVLDALQAKHREGVRIQVLADSCALYKPGGKDAFRFLESTGIPVAEFNPIRLHRLAVAPVMIPRDHRKFWVVDGKTLFLGGANLYANSLKAPEKKGNLDLMVKVDSPETIECLVESFVATWNRSSKQKLDAGDFTVPPMEEEEGRSELWLSDQNRHVGKGREVERMFDGLFEIAENEIWLIQPYTFVTPDLLRQFRELEARGVEVNVMLSRQVEAPRFHLASHFGIKEILEAGGRVWLYDSDQCPLHSKAVLVDGRWASIGSANLNLRSYRLSKEANVVFGDPEAIAKVTECLEKLQRDCREITLEEAREYRGIDYGTAWALMQWLG